MATKEEISMIGFEIVAYAGDAQTDLIAACEKAREGDIEEARRLRRRRTRRSSTLTTCRPDCSPKRRAAARWTSRSSWSTHRTRS